MLSVLYAIARPSVPSHAANRRVTTDDNDIDQIGPISVLDV